MIGLLGGSFDPIHNGHLSTAQSLFQQLDLSQLRFVVAREQPLKQGHSASAEHRARMVELAIADMPAFALELIELNRPGPSYTVDTLRALREREPEEQWMVLLGSDAARDLDRWREAALVARLARVVVFGRTGEAVAASPLVSGTATVPPVPISATEVRKRVRDGLAVDHLVPLSVVRYIQENRLYL